MKSISLVIIFCITLFLSSCIKRELDRNEADKSMKVLNSDIVNLLTKSSETPEFKALKFLMSQASTPLPYILQKETKSPLFKMEDNSGIYRWNDSKSLFEKSADTTNITLLFPMEDNYSSSGKLILYDFISVPYTSKPPFPTQINGSMFAGDEKILTVDHTGKISNGIPETIENHIEGKDYHADLDYLRTRENTEGDVNIDISFNVKGYDAIKLNIYARIEYGRKSYFYKTFKFKLDIFSHQIDADIDYASIDPTSHDYVNSFNQYSQIQLFEMPNGKKVGDIVLGKTEDKELLDYFIRFSNGDQILLTDYIPLLKKISNLKY